MFVFIAIVVVVLTEKYIIGTIWWLQSIICLAIYDDMSEVLYEVKVIYFLTKFI